MNKWFWLLCLTLGWISCGENQNEFSSTRCFLEVNNQEHNNHTLASAMTSLSPGVFCIVQQTMKGGAPYFYFKNNYGNESYAILNAKEQRMHLIIGLNNGVIVGFDNLNQPATFYAYDLQCPNCFDVMKIPRKSYPLTLSANGIAICNVCHREYNLNIGGIISKGKKGEKLIRYHATTSAPNGVLHVY